MGIRESMNKQPALTSGVVIVIIVLSVGWLRYWFHPRTVYLQDQFYFTDDDGKTFYPDAMANLPPYAHNGKEAVVAHVYQIGNNSPFIGFMEKLTPEMHTLMSQVPPPDIDYTKGTMYKRPGDIDWEMATDPDGRDIARNIKPPPGESGFPNPVLPTVGS